MFAMKFFIVLLLFATCAYGFNRRHRRIIGSHVAPRGKFPYQVSVQTSNKVHYCTGSIINNRYILSAAHCNYVGHKEYTALVGTLDWKDVDLTGVRYQIKGYIIHEDFKWSLLINDIALLGTVKEMEFNKLVAPIALGKDFVDGDVKVLLSGWGVKIKDGDLVQELHYVKLRTLTNEQCESASSQARLSRTYFPITEGHICTSTETGVGFCRGDDGSGLANVDNDKLIEIASRRMDKYKRDCATGLPDVYTRVSEYVQWIEKKLGHNFYE